LSAVLLNMMKGDYSVKKDPNAEKQVYSNTLVRAMHMVADGLRYCKESFWGRLVSFRAILGFQYGAMDVVIASLSETLPGNSTFNLTLLYLTLGMGSFLGPAAGAHPQTLKQSQLFGVIGIIINVAGIAGMGITNTLLNNVWAVGFFNIVRASGGKLTGVNGGIILNQVVDDHMMGRVMALDYIFFVLFCSTGAIFSAVLQDYLYLDNSETAFVVTAAAALIALSWTMYHNSGKGTASPECLPFNDIRNNVPKNELSSGGKDGTKEKEQYYNPKSKTNPFHLWVAVLVASGIGIYFAMMTDLNTNDDDNAVSTSEAYYTDSIESDVGFFIPSDAKLSDFSI